MSDADGAGFLIAYLTGWLGLVTRGELERGEWLAVLGAAGGTGSAAIQIGRALGARVIAVVGGPDKAEYCRGARSGIHHRPSRTSPSAIGCARSPAVTVPT